MNNTRGGIHNSGTMTLNQVIVNNNNALYIVNAAMVFQAEAASPTRHIIINAATVRSNMGYRAADGIRIQA